MIRKLALMLITLFVLSSMASAFWTPSVKYIPEYQKDYYQGMDRTGYTQALDTGKIIQTVSRGTKFSNLPYSASQLRKDSEYQARFTLVGFHEVELQPGERFGRIQRLSRNRRTGLSGLISRLPVGGRIGFRNVPSDVFDFKTGDRVTFRMTKSKSTLGTAYATDLKFVSRPGSTIVPPK